MENITEMSEPFEHNLIQTYLTKPGRMISTMYRQCSAMLNPYSWYYETIVWEWERSTKERGAILHTEDSGSVADAAHRRHAELIRRIVAGEKLENEEQ